MTYSPITVANYFIKEYGRGGDLTPMKILKLTYIAYGWYLAITDDDSKLTYENPLAWDYGPVFPSLYASIKKSGQTKIRALLPTDISESIIEEDQKFLDKIWDIYGKYDGVYLSALTHQEGTPWHIAYNLGRNHVIKDSEIKRHYEKKIKKTV